MKKPLTLPSSLARTLKSVLSIPTTSFHEQWLASFILKRVSGQRGVSVEQDHFGNILIHYHGTPRKKATLCLQAHLDHPGFAITDDGLAEAFGGIPTNIRGAKLRFFDSPKSRGVLATITKAPCRNGHREYIELRSSKPLPKGSIGMWDQPILKQQGEWLLGRAFDDTLSVGILLSLLEQAVQKKWKCSFDILFTRAEEVGFIGTIELLRRRTLKLPQTIITLEVPRASGDLVAGNGVMIRAGDARVCFDPELILQMETLAVQLQTKNPNFQYQRRLGLRGGIESSCFQLYGYQVGSLCVAVDNGHNIDLKNSGRPAPEKAHLRDILSLYALVEALLTTKLTATAAKKGFQQMLLKRADSWASDLLKRQLPGSELPRE